MHIKTYANKITTQFYSFFFFFVLESNKRKGKTISGQWTINCSFRIRLPVIETRNSIDVSRLRFSFSLLLLFFFNSWLIIIYQPSSGNVLHMWSGILITSCLVIFNFLFLYSVPHDRYFNTPGKSFLLRFLSTNYNQESNRTYTPPSPKN